MKNIRTRFAPSPTGFMHIGGVRTALFAHFIAKQENGTLILRIEDTDKAREVEGSVEHIIKSLEWLGVEWQEGPDKGGPHGPYKQSERLDIYRRYAEQLLASGKAYVDNSTPEQVAAWRTTSQKAKLPFLFREHREEAAANETWDGSKPLRFKSDPRRMDWKDEVRGDLTAGDVAMDDFVIIKADGYPTYNFAHVVDDHEMEITHVVRGEEFIASTPKFIDLTLALGFDLPAYVTVPPILNANGGKKLSKRDGARDVLEYRDDGYLPEAVTNFLASMGWNDGTEQEIFTPGEIVEKFSVDRIQSSGAKYDEERLKWINGHHIRNMKTADLYGRIAQDYWPESASAATDEYKIKVLGATQERLKYFNELAELTQFFFETITPSKELLTKKIDEATAKEYLDAAIGALSDSGFTHDNLEETLRTLVEQLETKAGLLFRLIRVAVVGGEIAPGLFDTLAILGKETCIARIESAKSLL